MFSSSFVCLSATLHKNFRSDLHNLMKSSEKVGNGANEQMINFGGDPNGVNNSILDNIWE